MFHLKIGFRHRRKNKTYSFINITGLSLSLAVSILLLLWTHDELSYDKFNTHAANLYRLLPKVDNGGSSSVWNSTSAPSPYMQKMKCPR